MFTGIVEQRGRVQRLVRKERSLTLRVEAPGLARQVAVGDSVSVSGVCLTAVCAAGDVLDFDVITETVERTTLRRLTPGDAVNLELAMRADGRFGGHFVMGHVDGVGRVLRRDEAPGQTTMRFGCPPEWTALMIPKGSVALDGVSLTLFDLQDGAFAVGLIPHTLEDTTLGLLRPGDGVNIEVDCLGKWVQRLLRAAGGEVKPATGLAEDGLRGMGY